MTDQDPKPAGDAATPTADELARAVPATVRRAPRYRAWVAVGAALGAVVGLVIALAAGDDGGPAAVAMVVVLALVVGGLAGGVAALAAERTRRR